MVEKAHAKVLERIDDIAIRADGNGSMGTMGTGMGTDKCDNGIFNDSRWARSSVRLERRTLNP